MVLSPDWGTELRDFLDSEIGKEICYSINKKEIFLYCVSSPSKILTDTHLQFGYMP